MQNNLADRVHFKNSICLYCTDLIIVKVILQIFPPTNNTYASVKYPYMAYQNKRSKGLKKVNISTFYQNLLYSKIRTNIYFSSRCLWWCHVQWVYILTCGAYLKILFCSFVCRSGSIWSYACANSKWYTVVYIPNRSISSSDSSLLQH